MKRSKKKEKVMCEMCLEKQVKEPKVAEWEHHIDENHKNDDPENIQYLCTLHHAEVHGISQRKSELKRLVILRDRALKARVASEHTIRSLKRIEYIVPEEQQFIVDEWNDYIKDIEKQIKQEFKESSNNGKYPLHSGLMTIKGIGTMSAAKLQVYIDISKSENAGKLMSFCGLNPEKIKRTKGISEAEAKGFGNNYLRKELLGIIADSFIKQRTPVYRDIYDNEKKQELAKVYPEGYLSKHCNNGKKYKKIDIHITKLHAHNRARRKMIQIFIQHYYNNDRVVNNLPVRKPYVEEKLHHTGIIKSPW